MNGDRPVSPLGISDLSSLRKRKISLSQSLLADSPIEDETERHLLEEEIEERRAVLQSQRDAVRWRSHTFQILAQFSLLVLDNVHLTLRALVLNALPVAVVLFFLAAGAFAATFDGPFRRLALKAQHSFLWYGWWASLGVLSSIGLGTGLHTFILFLAPHIAAVTTTAYECGHLSFPTRGVDKYQCSPAFNPIPLTLWRIYNVIKWEAFFWGTGTAIGELPPYFVARAAASAGKVADNTEEDLLESIAELEKKPWRELDMGDRAKLVMLRVLTRLGFIGIVLCASIPNPLFDLAGILCGHFRVPFWTFFGATFVGKAFFKATIQAWIVVALSSRDAVDLLLALVERNYPSMHERASSLVAAQTSALRSGVKNDTNTLFGTLWTLFLAAMIGYFVASTIRGLAIERMRKQDHAELESLVARAEGGKGQHDKSGAKPTAAGPPLKEENSTGRDNDGVSGSKKSKVAKP